MVINDNNNFAPSLFRSLCEFSVFSEEAEKYFGPKQSPPISHNALKKEGAQLLLSKKITYSNLSSQIKCEEENEVCMDVFMKNMNDKKMC